MIKFFYRSLLLTLLVSLTSCGAYKDVQLKGVEDVSVKEFTNSAIVVEVKAKIHNPNGYDITIYDTDLDFTVNGTKLGKAKMDENIVLKKKSEEVYTIIARADTEDISSKMGLLFPILMTGRAKINVKGDVYAKALFVKKKVPVEMKQEVKF